MVVGALLASPLVATGSAHADDPAPVEVVPPDGVDLGGTPAGFDLSADGRWVVHTGRKGAAYGIHLVDRTTGSSSPVLSGGTPVGQLSVSADGRRIAYVLGDVGAAYDGDAQVRLLDRTAGTDTLVSATPGGAAGNGVSYEPQISDDGSAVAFTSRATNLVSGTSGPGSDVVVREVGSGASELVSAGGATAGAWAPTISGDGDRVAFVTDAAVPGDDDTSLDVAVRTRSTDTLALVSAGAGTANATAPAISADGGSVAHLVAEGSSPELVHSGIHVTRLESGATERAGVDVDGVLRSPGVAPVLSHDGRFVLFTAVALGRGKHAIETFVRDLGLGTTHWVSTASQPGAFYIAGSAISGDGRFVAYSSFATDGTRRWVADLGEPTAVAAPRNTTLPAVSRGRAPKGPSYALTVRPGTWSDAAGVTTSHQWLRDGRPIAGATGTSYVVRRADLGRRIAVRETVGRAWGEPEQATSTATRVTRASSQLRATAAPTKVGRPVVLRVRVTHGLGVRPQGKVVVRWGKRSRGVRVDADGRMTLRVRGLRSGRHTVRVSFSPTPFVKAAPVVKVKVRVWRR
ncbi:hypothetical protein GCM10007231_11300 [Nocardioides daphniae]|uniref:Bacterial Ig-like domain-containing protein n=1 Tax=Nocardioides daphniae TaxID=402297 RepID=A0ABQ1Q6A2_9ACTN|nr:hypothetical protein GCM10007231_11300 [Nocardioides daphniae]